MVPVLNRAPEATAIIRGSQEYPDINGMVRMYQTPMGVLVAAEVMGLPTAEGECASPFLGFHIHEGERCSGTAEDSFANALGHYNPQNCEHPFHAGDLPPLLSNNGYALSFFLTDRFTVDEVMGKTIIIHEKPDDFVTQPSGNSGMKIACGQIKAWGV